MKNIIILSFVILLIGCTQDIVKYQGDPVDVITQGRWNWDGAEGFCKDTTHNVRFNEDRSRMYVNFYHGHSNDLIETTEYIVKNRNGAILSTKMVGEDYKDSSGNLVSWDLIVNSETEYCWRRSDWIETRCSAARLKCP